MSTSAIKDVTRALQVLLLSQLSAINSSAQVSLLPPGDKLPSGLGVNLYLFRTMESAFSRNQDWPGDRTTPGRNSPALGLELSYLLTPYAPAPDPATSVGDDAHIMLGTAMLALYQNPVLNNVHIPGFDADSVLPPYIVNSYEQVKVTLATTSLEELSRIWATINQPYRLSVAYHVSLVQLTPTQPPAVSGATVLRIGLDAIAWNVPRLNVLTPATGALAHVDGTGALVPNVLTIAGSNMLLPGHDPVVSIGGTATTLNAGATPTLLTVPLPKDVDGGPQVSVSVSLSGRTGAPLPLSITPWLSRVTPIRSTLETPALTLTGIGFTGVQAVRFESPGGTSTVTAFVGPATDTQIGVNIPATLANGLYKVRVVLAGPASNASNGAALEVIPAVASPIVLTTVTVAGEQVHRLTINGARLSGADTRAILDGVPYAVGANANAAQLVVTLGRLLDSGTHTLAVSIDGSNSHVIPLVVA